jgi:hypothetical protein
MTDHDLRDLLREQVADVTTTADLSAAAWSTSRAARRRRTLGVVAGATAATLLVIGGIAVIGNRSSDTPDPAPAPDPNPTADGHFRGAPVYWSPTRPEEADLPLMTSGRPPLPEVIDLSADAAPVEEDPIDRAEAAFGVVDDSTDVRLLLLATDGTYRTLDLSDVGADPTISCCLRAPVYDWMLSPTGEYVAFPQIDSVLVYDLPRREWRTIETDSDTTNGVWVTDTDLYLSPFSDGGRGPVYDVVTGEQSGMVDVDPGGNELDLEKNKSYQFGVARTGPDGVLQSWGSGAHLPVPDDRIRPEFLVATGDRTTILSFSGTPGGDGRWLQCCPAVGWAADDVAMYESRSGTPRIIAWTIGTHTFETVSTITGLEPGEQAYVGSYASYLD